MKTQKPVIDDAAVIRDLDRIREGRKVSVAITQSGYTVAVVVGRWYPRNMPVHIGWTVMGPGSPKASLAVILPTDRVTIFRDRGALHLRVDLAGHRMPVRRDYIRRARIAGILPMAITEKTGDAS